jgi:sulfoxide reductase heme-binding subunit YedZ
LIEWLRRHWVRLVTHLGSVAPLLYLAWRYAGGRFLDPVRQITASTGRTAIALLVLTLACTPVAIITGWRRVLRARKALGLYAFLYAALHFLTFAWWDYGLSWELLAPAIFGQRFVVYGLLSLLLLIPLAITSTRGWRRRLGGAWQRIHWLVYPAVLLAVVHYLRIGKDAAIPTRYAVLVGVLLVVRLPFIRRALSHIPGRLRGLRQTEDRSDALS